MKECINVVGFDRGVTELSSYWSFLLARSWGQRASIRGVKSPRVCPTWRSSLALVTAPSCRLAAMRCWSPTTGACLWCWLCCCSCWSMRSCICPLSRTTTTLWRTRDETSEPSFGCEFTRSKREYLIGLLFWDCCWLVRQPELLSQGLEMGEP